MQTVINKELKFIKCNESNRETLKELHRKYNITPLNISIDQRAKKIREAVKETEPEHYNNLTINYE